jgi:hypothetical protein
MTGDVFFERLKEDIQRNRDRATQAEQDRLARRDTAIEIIARQKPIADAYAAHLKEIGYEVTVISNQYSVMLRFQMELTTPSFSLSLHGDSSLVLKDDTVYDGTTNPTPISTKSWVDALFEDSLKSFIRSVVL